MNRDDIIRMAREAGVITSLFVLDGKDSGYFYLFERFAAIVAAAEREECAKLCDTAITELEKTKAQFSVEEALELAVVAGADHQAQRIADAIRARGQ